MRLNLPTTKSAGMWYSLLSKRFFAIVRRYTPDVEEYSIDECFADLTGLRRPLRMNYFEIAARMKKELDAELGFTFSAAIPAHNLAVSSLDGDSMIYARGAHPCGPDAGQSLRQTAARSR
jgi:impB/mucB/samB family